MLNTFARISAAPKQSKGAQFGWQFDPQNTYRKPSVAAFERYGICGRCEVLCRDGTVQIKNLGPAFEVISRDRGFVRPVAVLASQTSTGSNRPPQSVCVMSRALGGGLPQDDITLGAHNIVSRYLPRVGRRPQSMISLEPEENIGTLRVTREHEERLYIPIFADVTEILVAGVYLSCPSIADLTSLYAKGQRQS